MIKVDCINFSPVPMKRGDKKKNFRGSHYDN